LAPALVGRRIKRAQTKRADLRFPFPKRFAARLSGRRVDTLERRAKYLLAHLDDGNVWVTHLGMTGRWSVIGAKRQPGDFYYAEPTDPTHTHVVIEMEEGGRLEFNDPRRFGYMDLIAESELESHPFFKAMGPEPLGNHFHEPYLKSALARRSADQGGAAGSARRCWARQHLRRRSAASRRHCAGKTGGTHLDSAFGQALPRDPRRAGRSDRSGRLDTERLRRRQWRARGLPASLPCVRS
jgi:hypothetical protein